jgi:hypothetical protein
MHRLRETRLFQNLSASMCCHCQTAACPYCAWSVRGGGLLGAPTRSVIKNTKKECYEEE